MPLLVLEHDVAGPPLDEIIRLMREHDADGLVIGLPLSMDGSCSAQTLSVLSLARRLAADLGSTLEGPICVTLPEVDEGPSPACEERRVSQGIRVVLCDERLSSWQARRASADDAATRRTRAARGRRLDAHAAAVILQSFLEAEQSPTVQPDDLE